MKLIIGLGNPGLKYETTRHNIGWLLLDHLVDSFKARGPTSKNKSVYYEADISGEKVLLIKPQTFMNLSGQGVAPFVQFYKCNPEDILVLHDELDLSPGVNRLKSGGGSGGHNGLKSIEASLGYKNYYRLRLGIGHPRTLGLIEGSQIHPEMDVADFVLGQLSDQELAELSKNFKKLTEMCRLFVEGQVLKAMNLYHT